MAIEENSNDGSFEFICDEIACGESTVFETQGDFELAIEEAKKEGWFMKNIDGEWEHYCPKCSGG